MELLDFGGMALVVLMVTRSLDTEVLCPERIPQMRALPVVALIVVVGLAWLVGPEPGSLLLSGTALTGIGMLVRRTRQAQKEQV